MSKIKRFNIENRCHFVTTKTFDNAKIFNKEKNVQLFLKVLYEVKEKLNFLLIGFVIMPDHLHLMIVPETRNSISDVMRHIKGRFARLYNQSIWRINSADYETNKIFYRAGNSSPPKRKVWQNSFYDHVIRNRKEFLEKLNYIYNNPVKAKIVAKPEDYKFSSISEIYEVDLERYFGG